MARQWIGKCIQCNAALSYAEQLALRDASLGIPRPAMCPKCIRFEARGLRTTAMPQVRIEGKLSDACAPLGRLEQPEANHQLDDRPSGFKRDKFGVKDEEINALYEELLRQDTPVVIAVAPTGSGKSTFVPYRLLAPEGLPLETFTAGRQIVITQPRRDATIGITEYVGQTLHGADVGMGHEVGYRVRGEHACDWRNRMVYVTDGTLINWIVRGELDRISLIIIDEAHERSLNIDVILGLLTNSLPQFPHLKVLIVSATIDHEKFRKFFDSRLPGSLRCGVVECSGSKPVGLKMHWVNPQHGVLSYAKGPLRDLGGDVWEHLADAIVRLVVEMDSPHPTANKNLMQGDVLGFLHGAKPIQDACERIEARLKSEHPKLARNTDVYPLYAAVDEATRRKAIDEKKDPRRRRIVIASNAAETSLTIDSLVHVIDSGFIKQTQWDPIQEQAPLLPMAHSQAGCRQRWGRVGRTMEGFAWSLYTKEQFERIFPRDTVPEIQRACLDGVVLLAKRGGADQLNGKVFPWLDAPDNAEIESTIVRLTRQAALDADGDLTAAGVDAAFSGGEDALYARLLADADRFGFGIEVATILPFLKQDAGDLFPDDRDWEPERRRALRMAQDRLKNSCEDDLVLYLRVYQDWVSLKELPEGVTWKAPAVFNKLHHHIRGGEAGAVALQKELGQVRSAAKLHQVVKQHAQNLAALKPWIEEAVGSLRRTIRNEWAARNGIDASMLEEVAAARADVIRQLGAKKKELEDRAIDFGGLDRLRIIIARAFPQHVHIRSKAFNGNGRDELRYEPVHPDRPDPPMLGIGSSSCCRSQPPEGLIALGPKHQITLGNGQDGQQQRLLLAPFVVGIDVATLHATSELSDLALADYFREHLPRPAIGSEEDRRQQLHEALRRTYPPGMLVECRVQAVVDDDIQVDVLRAAGWGGNRIGAVGSGGDRKERANDLRERDFDFRYARKDQGKRRTRTQTLDEDLVDPIDEAAQAERESGAATSGKRRQHLEGSRSGAEVIFGRLRQIGRQQAIKQGDVVVAEVSSHTDLRAKPGLVLVTPASRERFRSFRELYKPGDDIKVEVLGPAPKGSVEQGLMVRESMTGVETVICTEDLVLLSEPALLASIPIGSVIPVRVESINPQQEQVSLTNLAHLEQRVRALNRDTSHSGVVARVDHDDRHVYVYVTLDQSAPERGLVIAVKVVMYREMFEQQGELRLPYREGDQVHVKVRSKEGASSRTRVTKVTAEEAATLGKHQITVESGRLCGSGPMSWNACARLMQASSSSLLQAAIRELYLASNELYGDRVITDLERRFPAGTAVEGKVTWVSGDGVKLALQDGVTGHVALNEITWWDQRPLAKTFAAIDEVRKAKVLQVDAGRQVVQLSFRQLTEDPWKGGIRKLYPLTKTVEGIVGNTISNRAFVTLEPGLKGSIHITDMRAYHGSFVHDVTDVVQSGDRVKVRVSQIDLAGKRIGLVLVARIGRVAEETTPLATDEPMAAQPADWNGPHWPWTEGENAIKESERPRPPRRPRPAKRVALEKRAGPTAWSLSWR